MASNPLPQYQPEFETNNTPNLRLLNPGIEQSIRDQEDKRQIGFNRVKQQHRNFRIMLLSGTAFIASLLTFQVIGQITAIASINSQTSNLKRTYKNLETNNKSLELQNKNLKNPAFVLS